MASTCPTSSPKLDGRPGGNLDRYGPGECCGGRLSTRTDRNQDPLHVVQRGRRSAPNRRTRPGGRALAMTSHTRVRRDNDGHEPSAGAGGSVALAGAQAVQDRQQGLDRRLPDWPRGMREALAADYVGLSSSTFRREWSEGRAPGPVHLTPGRQVWLREDLDQWLDRKAGRLNDPGVSRPQHGKDALTMEWDAACGDLGASPVS
jgi:predicted DNA-binding transcriptional regulator AlpA